MQTKHDKYKAETKSEGSKSVKSAASTKGNNRGNVHSKIKMDIFHFTCDVTTSTEVVMFL